MQISADRGLTETPKEFGCALYGVKPISDWFNIVHSGYDTVFEARCQQRSYKSTSLRQNDREGCRDI